MDDEFFSMIIFILLLTEAFEYLKIIMGNSRPISLCPSYVERDPCRSFAVTFNSLYNGDQKFFRAVVRMNQEVFDILFNLVKEELTMNSDRPVIIAKCRLFLTLSYLAQGCNKRVFSIAFKIGLKSFKKMVNETCDILWNNLGHIYLSVPNKTEWKQISSDINNVWNLPNCVGAIDGKHIDVLCPTNTGTLEMRSMVLLGICDANYTFTGIDIGTYVSESDGVKRLVWHSDFGQKFFGNQLDLPDEQCLPNSNVRFPHYFVGNPTFPLKTFLMRPYPGERLPLDRVKFNKRLSHARLVNQNAFGILVTQWNILYRTVNATMESAEKVTKAAVLLHNFMKIHDTTYIPPGFVDEYHDEEIILGQWRLRTGPPLKRPKPFLSNASSEAFNLRDQLKDYLLYN